MHLYPSVDANKNTVIHTKEWYLKCECRREYKYSRNTNKTQIEYPRCMYIHPLVADGDTNTRRHTNKYKLK